MQRVSPTRLCNVRFNRDVKLKCCIQLVIGEDAFIQAGMLMLHRTLNCEAAAANQLHAFRQGPIISRGKHKQDYKEEFMLHF